MVVNLNRSKTFFKTAETRWATIKMRALRILISWWMYLIMIFTLLAVWGVLMLILYLPDSSFCYAKGDGSSYPIYIANRSLSMAIAALIIILFSILIVIDMYINRRVLQKYAFKQFLQKDDPYYFRMETIFYAATVPWVILFGWVSFAGSVALTDTRQRIAREKSLLLMQYYLDLAPDIILVGIITLFPLIITIYKVWRNWGTLTVKNRGEIEELLHNPDLHAEFKKFAEAEWSVENVLLYDDIIEFEASPTEDEAYRIINTYLKPNSPLETNVPGRCLVEINENISNGMIDHHLFESTKNQVMLNLTDTFSRFIYSEEFVEYKASMDLKSNVMSTIQ